MMKSICIVCLIVLSASVALAQARNSDRCEVAVSATNPKDNAVLGKFTTVLGEEELTTKAFRLPGTRLFIVASVFYTDESMASEKGSDSVTTPASPDVTPACKRASLTSFFQGASGPPPWSS